MNLIDMSLPPFEFVLNRINDNYGSNFTTRNVRMGDEGVEVTTKYGRNTRVRLIAIPGRGLSGSRRVYYNRVQLDEFLAGEAVEVPAGKYFDTDDLLGEVLQQLNINISREDIISDVLPKGGGEAKIRISGLCPAYLGYIPVNVIDKSILLRTRVQNTILNGFEIPVGVSSD